MQAGHTGAGVQRGLEGCTPVLGHTWHPEEGQAVGQQRCGYRGERLGAQVAGHAQMTAEDFRLLLAGFELVDDPRDALAGQALEMFLHLAVAVLLQDIGGNCR